VDRALSWPASARSGSSLELAGGWSVALEFETLRFHHVGDVAAPSSWRLSVRDADEQELRNPMPESGLTSGAARWTLTCPEGAATGELRIRPWREGERMRPLGMSGRKKISDLLREHRVPASSRRRVPVVADEDGPLWLVGLCRDERTRLLPCTIRGITLLVDVHPGDGGPEGD
jgi:tRNA(Ile)-lysidine synthetase-like protein